jgi:transcriptional regulator with XRE-family HTH domain
MAEAKKEMLILDGVTLGQKIRLTRLARGLRQLDLASLARVNPFEVSAVEHDRIVRPSRRKRILQVLDLLPSENNTGTGEPDKQEGDEADLA